MDDISIAAIAGGTTVAVLVIGLIVRAVTRTRDPADPTSKTHTRAFTPVPVVRHLLAQRWMVGRGGGGLWRFEYDEERNRGLEHADDARMMEIFEDDALYGYVGTHFMRFGRDRFDDSAQVEVEVQLYWDTHATEPKVEMRLSNAPDDSTPTGMIPFETGLPGFDQLFQSRFANRATVERFLAGRERLAWVEQFASTWGPYVREVVVEDTIEAKFAMRVLRKGDPVQAVEALLQAMDGLASTLETTIDPSYVKAPPPDDTQVRYVMVMVLTQCIRCKAGLPLNGPLREVECSNCLSSFKLNADFWDLLQEPDKNFRQGRGGLRRNFTTDFSWIVASPRCGRCKAELPVAEVPVGTDDSIHCVACGAPSATFPAPAWLQQLVPHAQQLFGAERDAQDGQGAALQPEDKPAPVAMACPQCGGGLTITADMDRTVKCQYCQTDVFLPDALWKRLHPVKVASAWFMRLAPRT